MTVVALLADPAHGLLSSIIERGMMEGMTFTVPPESLTTALKQHATALRSYPEAILAHGSTPSVEWSISLEANPTTPSSIVAERSMRIDFGEKPSDQAGEQIDICVHGMLPPLEGSEDAAMFQTWIAHEGPSPPPMLDHEYRYWCDRTDIAYAIVELLKGKPLEGTFNLTGRRRWTLLETWSEFHDLVNRTKAGRTGEFDVSHLEAKGVPSIKAVRLASTTAGQKRPSLEAIHRFLEVQDGEGWRPKTPLRQSLMFVIAVLDGHQPR